MYPGPVFEHYPRVDRWMAGAEGRNAGLLTWDGARLLDHRLATRSRSLVMAGCLAVVPLVALLGLVMSHGRAAWAVLWIVMVVGIAVALGVPVLWTDRQDRTLLAELPRPVPFGAPVGRRAVGVMPIASLAVGWTAAMIIAIAFLAAGTTGLVTVPYLVGFVVMGALAGSGARRLLGRPPIAVDRATMVADLRMRIRAFYAFALPVAVLSNSVLPLTDNRFHAVPLWTVLVGNTGFLASLILLSLANVGQVDGVPRRIRPMVAG